MTIEQANQKKSIFISPNDLQIHVTIIGLDTRQHFVVVADIDKDLGIVFDCLK